MGGPRDPLLFQHLHIKHMASKKTWKFPKIPVGFFILYGILELALHYLDLSNWPQGKQIMGVAALLALYFGIIRITAFVFLDYFVGSKKAIAIPVITRDLILFIVYIIVVMIVLRQKLNIDVTSLIATSAILTAIIGLALQETLSNLFSGLALNVEKPYKVGDWVAFDKYRGQVKSMSWRSTKLLTPENESIFIPNNLISKSHIVNFSDPSTLIISGFIIGLEYRTAPNRVRNTIFECLRNHPDVISDREMEVRLIDFADSSIKYEVRYWIDIHDDYESADRIKSEIMTQLWYKFRRSDIKVSFPIRVQTQLKESSHEEILEKTRNVLEKVELLAPLKTSERELLAQNVTVLDFAEGEEIVQQGASGTSMYVIGEGECTVIVRGASRLSKTVATLSDGDFFGEMSLMTGAERSATVVAKTDCLLYEIRKNDMLKVLEANPNISTTLSELLAKREAERGKILSEAESSYPTEKPPSANQILQKIRTFFRLR